MKSVGMPLVVTLESQRQEMQNAPKRTVITLTLWNEQSRSTGVKGTRPPAAWHELGKGDPDDLDVPLAKMHAKPARPTTNMRAKNW
jgi:hypothetical protein